MICTKRNLNGKKWRVINGKVDIVIFEGWCVGAKPQPADELIEPVNSLEKLEYSDGVWRRYVNDVLANEYQQLFKLLDLLIMLEVPSFDLVLSVDTQHNYLS